jgi:hypothetical protein
VFLATIDVILELDADLAFGWLVPNERMLQQLLRVWSLVVVLHQNRFDKTVKEKKLFNVASIDFTEYVQRQILAPFGPFAALRNGLHRSIRSRIDARERESFLIGDRH